MFAKDFPDFTVVYCEEQGWGGEVVYEGGEVITDRFWNIPEYECVDEEEDIYYLKTPLEGSDYIEEMPVGYYNGRPIVGWADYIGETIGIKTIKDNTSNLESCLFSYRLDAIIALTPKPIVK